MAVSQRLNPAATWALGFGIRVGELASERADRATASVVDGALVVDHPISPGAQALQGAEIEPLVVGDDLVRLMLDDGPDQRRLVVEVVVELRA